MRPCNLFRHVLLRIGKEMVLELGQQEDSDITTADLKAILLPNTLLAEVANSAKQQGGSEVFSESCVQLH
jgi:hypothetical protein